MWRDICEVWPEISEISRQLSGRPRQTSRRSRQISGQPGQTSGASREIFGITGDISEPNGARTSQWRKKNARTGILSPQPGLVFISD